MMSLCFKDMQIDGEYSDDKKCLFWTGFNVANLYIWCNFFVLIHEYTENKFYPMFLFF